MTENQWPQDASYRTPAATRQGDLGQPPTVPVPVPVPGDEGYTPTPDDGTAAGGTSQTVAAQEQAGEVARQAADSARNVAETAKSEAANVAAEVKINAKDLLYQAKSDLTEQAATQQQKVAQGLRSISAELHSMASAPDQPGVAADLVRQAAERSSAVASWLDDRDPGSLLDEVKSFARQRPGTFLMLAAGAGILAGRLSRSLAAGAPDTGTTAAGIGTTGTGTTSTGAHAYRVPDTGVAVPPAPVQLPAPATTTAGLAETYPPNPVAAEGTERDQWPADPAAADPYRNDPRRNDPRPDDPFDGGQR
ncbi:hypothetical protein [Pseudarthrobacter albicanus]|uniref:hypothetical protein n=1 Tax=Pseudarthrobacter albicanus TaxID=2823873 RepID=UPI001BAD03A9|nr:hypothetical protein [Pseudarthrobacter albicanus]